MTTEKIITITRELSKKEEIGRLALEVKMYLAGNSSRNRLDAAIQDALRQDDEGDEFTNIPHWALERRKIMKLFVWVVLAVPVIITTVLACSVVWHIGAAMAQVIILWLMLG